MSRRHLATYLTCHETCQAGRHLIPSGDMSCLRHYQHRFRFDILVFIHHIQNSSISIKPCSSSFNYNEALFTFIPYWSDPVQLFNVVLHSQMSPLLFESILYSKYHWEFGTIDDIVEANKRWKNELQATMQAKTRANTAYKKVEVKTCNVFQMSL